MFGNGVNSTVLASDGSPEYCLVLEEFGSWKGYWLEPAQIQNLDQNVFLGFCLFTKFICLWSLSVFLLCLPVAS